MSGVKEMVLLFFFSTERKLTSGDMMNVCTAIGRRVQYFYTVERMVGFMKFHRMLNPIYRDLFLVIVTGFLVAVAIVVAGMMILSQV